MRFEYGRDGPVLVLTIFVANKKQESVMIAVVDTIPSLYAGFLDAITLETSPKPRSQMSVCSPGLLSAFCGMMFCFLLSRLPLLTPSHSTTRRLDLCLL